MGKKNSTPSAGATGVRAIRIGTRVRCTDDRVEGRITWANANSVKVKWDDGEEVTWKRAELAGKPLEFLDIEPAQQPGAPAEQAAAEPTPEQATAAEVPAREPAIPVAPAGMSAPEQPIPTPEQTNDQPWGPAAGTVAATTPATKPKRRRKPKAPAEPKVKQMSAIDAAAKVLAETGTPMSCKELIGAMAAKSYWTSPGGKTPDATLHASLLREISVKGEQSRFVKAAPGRFGLRPAAPAPGPARDGN
jgi:hypothetical protein